MRWRRSQPTPDEGPVVGEARAVLEGTVRAQRYAQWRRLPAWVYVNELAHADVATLARLAQRRGQLHPATFEHASAFLAAKILLRASGESSLSDVQRSLVPLELDLLGEAYPAGTTAATLLTLALDALAASGSSPSGL
jgi:hypothetical protein